VSRSRRPAAAGLFYPSSPRALRGSVESMLAAAARAPLACVVGGLVPHAGHAYSGLTAAAFFASVPEAPESVVFVASVHRPDVERAALCACGTWSTPLGEARIDEPLARAILEAAAGRVVEDPGAHDGDHAIEVQLPFLAARWPEATFVPIVVPPDDEAPAIGAAIAGAIAGTQRRALVVASSDLTHYGARYGFAPWGAGPEALRRAHGENDVRLLGFVERLDASGALRDAETHRSACGGGAIAAACAASRARGARRAVVLARTASSEVEGDPAPSVSVGYASAAIVREEPFTIAV